ncbi:hypothetical protein [Pedobacter arcticus]|uniref:hypothetical protein n=1 Tax=Pedobacter arcticus TaxID=752140 RepID=UPI00031FB3BF|nr:hypothetical protein [Pedobacter arcticus]
MKSPAERMNDFKEELEEKNPIKKEDLGAPTNAEEIPEKKGSYSETSADKARVNKGAIGIDRDAGQM